VKEFANALTTVTDLLREVKRLDDKPLLVEILLIETRIHHSLRNLPKAKASLTAARSNANAIYCSPTLQSQIDLLSGTLHAEERDYKTAYSYFLEAFEGAHSVNDPQAIVCLKYMLLCKIMTNTPKEVASVLSGKSASRYAGSDVQAMEAVAKAHQDRSLHNFESALNTFKKELADDSLIHTHLNELYSTLLEQNLCRIIEPFSCVEITHVAHLIGLSVHTVEQKLSQMILDKKFQGILDQGAGNLILFDDPIVDKTYPTALQTIENVSHVVESLYEKASKLT